MLPWAKAWTFQHCISAISTTNKNTRDMLLMTSPSDVNFRWHCCYLIPPTTVVGCSGWKFIAGCRERGMDSRRPGPLPDDVLGGSSASMAANVPRLYSAQSPQPMSQGNFSMNTTRSMPEKDDLRRSSISLGGRPDVRAKFPLMLPSSFEEYLDSLYFA